MLLIQRWLRHFAGDYYARNRQPLRGLLATCAFVVTDSISDVCTLSLHNRAWRSDSRDASIRLYVTDHATLAVTDKALAKSNSIDDIVSEFITLFGVQPPEFNVFVKTCVNLICQSPVLMPFCRPRRRFDLSLSLSLSPFLFFVYVSPRASLGSFEAGTVGGDHVCAY